MITGPFYTYRQIHFISGNVLFGANLLKVIGNYPSGPHVTFAPGRAPSCYRCVAMYKDLQLSTHDETLK